VENLGGKNNRVGRKNRVGRETEPQVFFRPDAMVWCMRIVVVLVLTVAR
jgi:hypothetical protein